MSKKRPRIKRKALPRQWAASLAGLRAGGAFAVDNAWQKMRPGSRDTNSGDTIPDSAFARREARRFVNELGQLKGTYVKIGQMLALLGEHVLPPVLTQALHDLGHSTEPLEWEDVEPIFRQSLGPHYEELDIDHEAVAAASLAQVHRATVRESGAQICLKLQYPGLAEVIDSDFDAVIRMLMLARWLKTGRDLDDWLGSMREHLHHEIDYAREARLHQKMYQLVQDNTRGEVTLYVPRLFPRYCSDHVLAMEYIEGSTVTGPGISSLPLKRRNALAKAMLELFFIELYEWGLLQTDPNFGNYLIQLTPGRRPDKAADKLVLLDFGSTLECDDNFLLHLRAAIAYGLEGAVAEVGEALVGLGCLPPDSGVEAREHFAGFCLQLLEPLQHPSKLPKEYLNKKGEYCWAQSRLLKRAGKQAIASLTRSDFTTPSRDFALIARKLTGVFTFISVLEAEFNAHEIVEHHIQGWRETDKNG
jgi:predicted unusual protein kinase regulating ubiquinone biosynthesis (AarF/ABC1/UbiB family)